MHWVVWIIATLVVMVVLAVYLGMPVLIHNSTTQAAHPTLRPVDINTLPAETAAFMRQAAGQLAAEGFSVVDVRDNSGNVPNVTSYVILLVNRSAGDLALIAAFYGPAPEGGEPLKLQTLYHEFSTYFADGSEINTQNTDQLGVFKRFREKRVISLPTIRDPRTLYEVHRKVVEGSAPGWTKRLPPEGREVAELIASMREDMEKQAKAGYFYLDAAQDAYRPTWLGAYIMTWKLMWPFSSVRRLQRDLRARALLRSLGMDHLLQQGSTRTPSV